MKRNGPIALLFHALFVVFMLAPIVVVCVAAFTPHAYLSFPDTDWSLRWFKALADYPEFVRAFWHSLGIGALSATVAVLLAVPVALGVARTQFRGRDALLAFCQSPLMIPHVVLGIAFLRFFTLIGLAGTYVGLLIAHVIIVLPFALRLAMASSASMDPALERAAASLGASRWTTARRVVLPLIVPGLVSGWMLSFITSFDEVTMTVFIATPGTETLPVRMFLYIQDNIDPLVTAVAAALIVVTVVLWLLLDRLVGLETLLLGRTRGDR